MTTGLWNPDLGLHWPVLQYDCDRDCVTVIVTLSLWPWPCDWVYYCDCVTVILTMTLWPWHGVCDCDCDCNCDHVKVTFPCTVTETMWLTVTGRFTKWHWVWLWQVAGCRDLNRNLTWHYKEHGTWSLSRELDRCLRENTDRLCFFNVIDAFGRHWR